ncbi:hypothetical protein HK096_000262 [Nowakowskiella sp. JEL0078]|nr:hypothetical protein HK096_000262 [Nowakowskiella sp. JEL0078]
MFNAKFSQVTTHVCSCLSQFEDGPRASDEFNQDIDLKDKQFDDAQTLSDVLNENVNEKDTPLTFRALFLGTLLGLVVTASNMYLGFTIGWSFGASLFGSIIGFSILKPLSKILPVRFGGGYFGPKENCTVQTAATAAGGLSVGFVSAIPALYRLGLMSAKVTDDIPTLILWSFAAAYFGLFFAIPLRKYFILRQKLVFPSATVAAETIRSLHDNENGGQNGYWQAKFLLISFVIALVLKATVFFVPVLLEWHVLYWIGRASNVTALMAADVVWKWRIEISLAFVGAGMMVGTNTSVSFFSGSVIAWGVIGPILLGTGAVSAAFGYPEISDIKSTSIFAIQNLTAQFWLLWPGVTLMVVSSFAELAGRWKSLLHGIQGLFSESKVAVSGISNRSKTAPVDESEMQPLNDKNINLPKVQKKYDDSEDPALPHEQVPVLWWSLGLLTSVIFSTVVLTVFFHVNWYEAVLALVLGFIFAFVGVQVTGDTDITPIGSIGKTSQFIFAAFQNADKVQMLRSNLIHGQVAAACAAQTVDMVSDLKTGHLLRASPRSQFLAQLVGSFFAVFFSVGLFTLFGTSYPCLLQEPTKNSTSCTFEAPSVQAWTAVSVMLVSGIDKTIPSSSAYTCLAAAIGAVAFTFYKFVPGKYREYLPNLNAIGIAFVNPQPYIGLAMLLGAIVNIIWKKRSPATNALFLCAIASGLVAGEGIGGIVEALYTLAGLNQQTSSLKWGIPQTSDISNVETLQRGGSVQWQ